MQAFLYRACSDAPLCTLRMGVCVWEFVLCAHCVVVDLLVYLFGVFLAAFFFVIIFHNTIIYNTHDCVWFGTSNWYYIHIENTHFHCMHMKQQNQKRNASTRKLFSLFFSVSFSPSFALAELVAALHSLKYTFRIVATAYVYGLCEKNRFSRCCFCCIIFIFGARVYWCRRARNALFSIHIFISRQKKQAKCTKKTEPRQRNAIILYI